MKINSLMPKAFQRERQKMTLVAIGDDNRKGQQKFILKLSPASAVQKILFF
jgi:hypothetical protein